MQRTSCYSKHHDLKSVGGRFEAIWDGRMVGESRNNDKDFQVGDTVTFIDGVEISDDLFVPSGRTINAVISYIDTFSAAEGHVILSYKDIGIMIIGLEEIKEGDLVEVYAKTGRILDISDYEDSDGISYLYYRIITKSGFIFGCTDEEEITLLRMNLKKEV